MRMGTHNQAIWLENAIITKRAKVAIEIAAQELQEKGVEFDTIAFSGASGMLFAPVLAHRMDKEMILVRKSSREESRHSIHDTEVYQAAKRVLIVDDICSSGATIQRIIEGVRKHAIFATFVGSYFYANGAGNGESPKG